MSDSFFAESARQKQRDPRDEHLHLTSSDLGRYYADNLLITVSFDAERKPHIQDNEDFREWIGAGSQLSLAAGNAVGELAFGKELGISPDKVTCVDRNVPPEVAVLQSAGVTYINLDIIRWGAQDLLKRTREKDVLRFRVITLFGAEYAFQRTKEDIRTDEDAKTVLALAIFSALEPGGFFMIEPAIESIDSSLKTVGLKRVGRHPQVYQKPLH